MVISNHLCTCTCTCAVGVACSGLWSVLYCQLDIEHCCLIKSMCIKGVPLHVVTVLEDGLPSYM